MAVVSKQVNMELAKIKQKCPLYEANGQAVSWWQTELFKISFTDLEIISGDSVTEHDVNTQTETVGIFLAVFLILSYRGRGDVQTYMSA